MAKLTNPEIWVECPYDNDNESCGEHIRVEIKVTMEPGPVEKGWVTQIMKCDPDLTDVWAHAWTHRQPGEDPEYKWVGGI